MPRSASQPAIPISAVAVGFAPPGRALAAHAATRLARRHASHTTLVGARRPQALDERVRHLNAREAACRLELGVLAHALCRDRTYQRLGFVRLGDYARERLGWCARELETLAQVASALPLLPAVATAFADGDLSWTRTRLLAVAAHPETEDAWLAHARHGSIADLATLVRTAAAGAVRRNGANDSASPGRDLGDPIDRRAAAAAIDDAADLIDGEAALRFRLRCPPRVAALFHETVELASRMSGASLSVGAAAEAIAAEAHSGAPCPVPTAARSSAAPGANDATGAKDPTGANDTTGGNARVATDLTTAAATPRWLATERAASASAREHAAMPGPAHGAPTKTACRLPAALVAALDAGAAALGPRELDARLRAAAAALRTVDWEIGRILHSVRRRRLYRALGFHAFEDYVRDRLAIAPRTARALLAAHRVAARCARIREAYRRGALSWLQVLTLAPVLARPADAVAPVGDAGAPVRSGATAATVDDVAASWVERAGRVTLRRLGDEVRWAMTRAAAAADHEALGRAAVAGDRTSLAPPPLDAQVENRQIGAREKRGRGAPPDAPEGVAPHHAFAPVALHPLVPPQDEPPLALLNAEIAFTAPASIVALFRSAIAAFAAARQDTRARVEPLWLSCERMLLHVHGTWQAQPAHPDPIFARDGWRCKVPACSGRRNLHDHHLRFRSHGGDNQRTNRTTVCAAHHLHGIHAGLVRAWGTAPDAIRWQLGIEGRSTWALLDFLGDRYLDVDDVLAERAAAKHAMAARLAAHLAPPSEARPG